MSCCIEPASGWIGSNWTGLNSPHHRDQRSAHHFRANSVLPELRRRCHRTPIGQEVSPFPRPRLASHAAQRSTRLQPSSDTISGSGRRGRRSSATSNERSRVRTRSLPPANDGRTGPSALRPVRIAGRGERDGPRERRRSRAREVRQGVGGWGRSGIRVGGVFPAESGRTRCERGGCCRCVGGGLLRFASCTALLRYRRGGIGGCVVFVEDGIRKAERELGIFHERRRKHGLSVRGSEGWNAPTASSLA